MTAAGGAPVSAAPKVPARVGDAELVVKRRRTIVRAATRLMLKQGYHKTSVREIAEAADLPMGTLYLYISRKEDVLYLITREVMQELYGTLTALEPTATPLETLRRAVEHFFAAVHSMRQEVRLMYRESASLLPEHLDATKQTELEGCDFFAAIIRDGIARGEFNEVDADVLARNIVMLGHMWSLKAWSLPERCDYASYFREQFDYLSAVLCQPPA